MLDSHLELGEFCVTWLGVYLPPAKTNPRPALSQEAALEFRTKERRKTRMRLALAALILTLWIAPSASAGPLGPKAKMSGADTVYGSTQNCAAGTCAQKRGGSTCTSLRSICQRINNGSPRCQAAHTNCMATGVFAGPRGQAFNVARQ